MVQIFLDVLYWGKHPIILGNYTLASSPKQLLSKSAKNCFSFQRHVYFFPDLWGYLFVCMFVFKYFPINKSTLHMEPKGSILMST